jgi:hypothetical protein
MKFLPNWYQKNLNEFYIKKLYGQHCVKLIAEPWGNPLSGSISPDLALVRRRVKNRFVGHGKILNRYWIKTRELQRWKNDCNQNHNNSCQVRPAISHLPDVIPDWLIDTRRQCLIRARPELPYFALSYVWGGMDFFKALEGNMQQLQCENAFSTIRGAREIPQTIKDAMALVTLLGERYLWVDSLCIVQDNESCKGDQINKMAAIFERANVTIIAEGPNPLYGLRGLYRVSRPRNLPPSVYELQKGIKIVESRRPKRVGKSIWCQRGWTFQEHLFSRRRIIFYEGTVRWECDSGIWYEGFDQPIKQNLPHSTIRSHQWLFQLPYPDLKKYNELVAAFNVRQLTHPQDILRAFAGITSSLSSKFDGGFLCGLPVLFFDIALLWRPFGPLKRRISSDPATQSCIPSWSWAGWQGEIDQKSWLPGYDYIFPIDSNYRITPLVKWYCHEREKSGKTLVESTAFKYRKTFFGQDREPPPNWTRHKCYPNVPRDAGSIASFDGYPDDGCALPHYAYKHDSVPEPFWYPIPLCSETQDHLLWPTAPFLSCKAEMAWFYLGEEISRARMSFSIRDLDGSWAGAIRLHEHLPKGSLISYDQKSVPRQKCELAAISLGHAYNSMEDLDLDEWKMIERPESTRIKYEFYNVLWIEWKEGFAYRKGIGRVVKEIWECQKLKCIDLKLG